jgi:hypothetical protein
MGGVRNFCASEFYLRLIFDLIYMCTNFGNLNYKKDCTKPEKTQKVIFNQKKVRKFILTIRGFAFIKRKEGDTMKSIAARVTLFSSVWGTLFAFMTNPVSAVSYRVDLESGIAMSGYNDVRIPGDSGTTFSLSEDLEIESAPFIRGKLICSLGKKHHIELLVAPLSLDAEGELDKTVEFNGVTFQPSVPLKSKYRFDSYRATYRYDFYRGEKLLIGAGFTGKVRDAAISLSDGTVETEKKNRGFVPLVHFLVKRSIGGGMDLLLQGDALASPQGRAEDVLGALLYNHGSHLRFKIGYRILEGGADVEEVYTFALIHYLVLGASLEF